MKNLLLRLATTPERALHPLGYCLERSELADIDVITLPLGVLWLRLFYLPHQLLSIADQSAVVLIMVVDPGHTFL